MTFKSKPGWWSHPPDTPPPSDYHATRKRRWALPQHLMPMVLFLVMNMILTQQVSAVCNSPSPPATFAAPTVSAIAYDIGQGPKEITLAAYDLGECDGIMTETLSVSSQTWLTLSGRTLTISSNDASLHGTSPTFTVTSTLDDTA